MKSKLSAIALALMVAGLPLLASAQTHTIRIDDGRVFVDGREQTKADLPASLDLRDLTASLSFTGQASTHFRLGSRSYSVQDGRLVETESPEGNFVVFLRDEAQPEAMLFGDRGVTVGRAVPAQSKTFNVYYELLDGHLKNLDELKTQFSLDRSLPVAELLEREANEAALMVRAFPRFELQSYLEELQNSNEPLYDDILREHLMEVETHRLASRILGTQDEDRRAELTAELHDRLDDIFELKQANRHLEIEQLDRRLRDLQTQMDSREDHREDIIQRRIRELLGQLH